MANKPLPRVSCQKCFLAQDFRSQENCIHCGARLNNWHIASQLQHQAIERKDERKQWENWEKEMEKDDGT